MTTTTKMLVISPPPESGPIVDKAGLPVDAFKNQQSELHQTITSFIKGGDFTTAAGSATQTIAVDGATDSDIAIVTVKTAGAAPKGIVSASAASGQINVVMSGDPSTDHVLTWVLLSLT